MFLRAWTSGLALGDYVDGRGTNPVQFYSCSPHHELFPEVHLSFVLEKASWGTPTQSQGAV